MRGKKTQRAEKMASREFQQTQSKLVAQLLIKEKRLLLQATRYGDATPTKGSSFPQGTHNLNVFFPMHGLFGAEVLCHHILK